MVLCWDCLHSSLQGIIDSVGGAVVVYKAMITFFLKFYFCVFFIFALVKLHILGVCL